MDIVELISIFVSLFTLVFFTDQMAFFLWLSGT
jgi:hypothetical protein